LTPAAVDYCIGSERAARSVLAALGHRYTVESVGRVARRMSYLDTFDWRLYRAGARLAVARENSERFLLWKAPAQEGLFRRPAERRPEFAWEIADAELRRSIEPLVEVRRLLPVGEVEIDARVWNLLGRRDKKMVEVVFERVALRGEASDGPAVRLRPTLRVVPLAGYDAAFERVRSVVERSRTAERIDGELFARVLEALGREPLAESRKPRSAISATMRTDAAMKSIFRGLFEEIRRNEPGVRGNVDSEFLHDLRVAVRRTRSGLAQVPAIFPAATVASFRKRFAWLGRATGTLRDLDVYLLMLPRYRDELPQPLREGLGPVEARLVRDHGVEHARVVRALDSRRYRSLLEAWADFLDREVPLRTSLANARRPVLEVAGERIRRAHRRVMKRGRSIDEDSPPERLHRLRIECKKLRYLLEFFSELYPAAEIGDLIKALKRLQTHLGEFNDLAVQSRHLEEWQRVADGSSAGDSLTREAIAELLRRLAERKVTTRREFRDRFEAFADPTVSGHFASLFGGSSA
jgi:CHAD domain-containing protein